MYNISSDKKVARGFTLIEVVVVMAIISILTSIVMTGITSTSRTQRELEINAREFEGVLREAQNYALTGKQANGGTNTCSFKVSWTAPSTYQLIAVDCGTPPTENTLVTYTLKNGVTGPSVGSVSFALPWGVKGGTVSSVQFSKASKHYFVCISDAGKIEAKSSCP